MGFFHLHLLFHVVDHKIPINLPLRQVKSVIKIINLTIEPLTHFLRTGMSQKYKLCYLKLIYVGVFSHWSEQKQTGLLKMHIHSLPVRGAFGKSEI